MKKLKLFISLWFTMFSVAVFAQAEFEKIAITQNTQDNLAGRLLVQDVTTGEIRYILKSVLDNKFNQPTGNATQYLDGAGNPTTFPVLGQSDRVITEVRNTTGATVTKGTVVYLTGASGGKPTIQKAQANAESTSSGTFGVIQSDINNNSNGYAVVIGTVLGVNTSSYTEGQVLWLSPTVAGGFTSTKPVAPNHAVYVAIVTLATTNGTIEVKVQNGYEIDELHDVLITSKANNDAIVYDSASGLWKNRQLVSDAITDGVTTVAPSQNAVFDALTAKENTSSKNVANGYAGLGSDGKLFSTQLPSITITDTFVVGSQVAMLALTAETGDVAVRTDLNKSYILKGTDPAVLANWQELLTPTSAVTSVFGRNGAVTAQNGDYTTALVTETTNKKYQTDNQALYNDATSSIQTQINNKANDSEVVKLTGDQTITGTKTFSNILKSGLLFINEAGGFGNLTGFTQLGGTADYFQVINGGNSKSTKFIHNGGRNLTMPASDGTLALTSQIPTVSGTTNYVPKFTAASTLGNSLIFDNGTNVGIGTTNPDGKLNVYTGASVTNATAFNAGDGSNSIKYIPYTSAGAYNDLSVVGGGLILGNINSKLTIGTWNGTGIQFGPTNTLISGKVGIKTTTPESGWDFDVAGIAAIGGTAGNGRLYVSSANTTNGITYIQARNLSVATPMSYVASSHTFDSNVTAPGFFQSSDLRLKDIVKRDGDVIKYKWKDKRDDKIHIGYVAQEVQKENPEQVNTDDKGMLSVNYIEILVEKIRKLEKEIELLKAK